MNLGLRHLFLWCVFTLLTCMSLIGAEHRGVVRFGGLPVPGASVTATRSETTVSAVTDAEGGYAFSGLSDGVWNVRVEMTGFSTESREVTATAQASAAEWELKMLPLAAMKAQPITARVARDVKPVPQPSTEQPGNADWTELQRRAADGLLINGSANNGATSPFSQSAAFGNNRRGSGPLYTGNLGFILGNSAFDALPYSLNGQNITKPDYNQVQGLASLGGPLKIPHLLRRNGPNLTLNYQWFRNRNVSTQSVLMPTAAERSGDLSATPATVIDPGTGLPFPNNRIPSSRISPQAAALLAYYPLPNSPSDPRYNYQVPIAGETHQDSLQSRFTQRLPRRNHLSGLFAYSSTRTDSPSVFGFLSKSNVRGINTGTNWLHMFNPRLYTLLGYQYSRATTRVTPFFANRQNVSGEAGITGNNQESANWGPPALSFSSGIAGLADAQSALTRNQTSGMSLDTGWSRARHNLTFGGLFRRQQFNLLSQEDPRGSFAFTGASTGSDFAGFLLGIPDTSSIAFGNADKYFRSSTSAIYANDDWRLRSGLTLNFGLRWEYTTPITELHGRLVNLDIAPGFSAASPVVGSLLRPDRNNLAPRAGFAWRPLSASSMVIRGGYGVYHDTSVYLPLATQMAQQSPLSNSLRIANTPENPLTLANGFRAAPSSLRNTFAVDPNYQIGYAQTWQISVQRDLPASLAMVLTYLGSKGTRAQQQFLPNTFPIGAVSPCEACPTGFTYVASNGNSIRHALEVEVRRRLRSGFTATVEYTFAKSIDNAAVGGRAGEQGADEPSMAASRAVIAQNWLDLSGERSLSSFDQRHLLSIEAQYTTGMGLHGGTLISGWRGTLFKDWTVSTTITAGSGLPLTPIYFAAVQGTGVTGTIRPNYTGADVKNAAPGGLFLNPAAYVAPLAGEWGNAGRNSITGPSQFTLDGSLSRTFRMGDRTSLDFRIDAVNALNHPVFPSWNTVITSAQFGLPNPAKPMRILQMTARWRFQ